MANEIKVNVIGKHYHRNGISGTSFWTIEFTFTDDEYTDKPMMATVFPSRGDIAVLALDSAGGVDLESCWRGDRFDSALRFELHKDDVMDAAEHLGTLDANEISAFNGMFVDHVEAILARLPQPEIVSTIKFNREA